MMTYSMSSQSDSMNIILKFSKICKRNLFLIYILHRIITNRYKAKEILQRF